MRVSKVTGLSSRLLTDALLSFDTMFSFRRKPKKEPDELRIRTSPSLPELNSQGILPWPEDLVDIAAIQQAPPPGVIPPQGATKISFQTDQGPISFHKPFRPSTDKANDGINKSPTFFGSKRPSAAFDKKRSSLSAARYNQRRARVPPTFNLMVSLKSCSWLEAPPLYLP